MIPNRVKFTVLERRNPHQKSGMEWALNAQFGNDTWTMATWATKPSKDAVEWAKGLSLRSFAVYHSRLMIPEYMMEVVGEAAR